MSETRTRLYLIRHCDVHNPDGVLYGHLPNFGLSEKGVRQAHALGRYLAGTGIRHIYTSPLQRARETASIIASHLDNATTDVSDDLVEARFGKYLQGVRARDVPWRRPLWLVHMVFPGVLRGDETVRAMAERVQRPLLRLLDEQPGVGGACISHGDPIQAFWVVAQGRPRYALHRLQCAKGGMLELDYVGRRLVNLRYRSPKSLAAPQAGVAVADASHA